MPNPRHGLALAAAASLAAGCFGRGTAAPASPSVTTEPAGYLGPSIALAAPPRGAMLAQGGAGLEPIAIAGQACDASHALTLLTIDGRPVDGAPLPLAGSGCLPFQATHASRWGLSIVTGTATNDAGQRGSLAQSFLRSPTWFSAAEGDPTSRAASGVLLQLGPAFLDDGDRTTPDDLATLAERALAPFDVEAAVGSPRFARPDADGDGIIDTVAHDCVFYTQRNWATGFAAWKDGPASRGAITVDRLWLVDGGISAQVTVHALALPFSVLGNVDLGCAGAARKTVSGTASADALVLTGTAALGLDGSGAPSVTFSPVAASLAGLRLDIDLGAIGDWTGLGSAVGDALTAEVRGPVQEAIAGAARAALGARLAALVGALGAFQASLTLPPLLGGVALRVDSGLDRLVLVPEGARLGSSVRVWPVAPVAEHLAASPLGAMQLGSTSPPALAGGDALGIGVSDDALQQLLHAAWLGGAFDAADLSARLDLGIPGARLALFATLPPVLMPRIDGLPGLDVGWGDLAFALTLPAPGGAAVEVRGWLSVVASMDGLDAAPGGQRFGPAFAPGPQVYVQVAEVNWGDGPATRQSVEELLGTAAANFLPALLAGAVSAFPLPALDLRAVDPALPPLTLSLQTPRLVAGGGYEQLSGRVRAGP